MYLLQATMNVGNVADSGLSGPQHQPIVSCPIPSLVQTAIHTALPAAVTLQSSSPSCSAPTTHIPLLNTTESISNITKTSSANLIKPSFFVPPSSSSPHVATSSVQTVPSGQPSVTLQRHYGTPLLQPFPPPNPSPSLTPPASTYAPVINRDKVRDAIQSLAQVYTPLSLKY